jgi:hypothetical protein
MVVQAAHPQKRAVLAAFNGEQAQPLSCVELLGPRRDVVGVLPGQRAPEIAHHLGVGVEGRVVRQVIEAESPQQQPGRR